ncbi:MAG: RNA methyltransferase [Drouetiella hepatica Uher 2000/2452]|uniref:RNA methyltransferase n=1 Tax=Drouetiella hepatica Uher 2000/2452 TaxID=904376 RepID=A0A951QDN5_9CYAN|nr:RNA methyltransferase [Drouetiella hepatica Uher 2000/2452]
MNRADYSQLPRHSLIVCATLVHSPVNLGGLCRTAEAFRLEAMVLADLAIAETHPFRNLAASAHHWQPLNACALDVLPSWLSQQRQLGYSLIALDANPAALPLTEFVFSQKTVLVLGQELTGIPAAILDQCDRALSIPQSGMVESLNVQTAGAIAIYEYIRQQSLSLT